MAECSDEWSGVRIGAKIAREERGGTDCVRLRPLSGKHGIDDEVEEHRQSRIATG